MSNKYTLLESVQYGGDGKYIINDENGVHTRVQFSIDARARSSDMDCVSQYIEKSGLDQNLKNTIISLIHKKYGEMVSN